MNLKVKRLNLEAQLPSRATDGSGYYDIYSTEDKVIEAGKLSKISTGWIFEIPERFILDIRPRGGLSNSSILIANSPGTLDSDYRGELFILLLNLSPNAYQVKIGDRIAQVNLQKVSPLSFTEVNIVSKTQRGEGALGSTGR